MSHKISRHAFLQCVGAVASGIAIAACQPSVSAPPASMEGGSEAVPEAQLTNAMGVTLPADALPLDQQYRLIAIGKPGEQHGGSFGHEMESLYNRAYPLGFGSESLTYLDKDRNVIGIACESWQQSEDGLHSAIRVFDGTQEPQEVFGSSLSHAARLSQVPTAASNASN